jgi:CheY-like chemotaxis protein
MKTILVVEDEYDLLATLRAILEGEGYATESCSDGREALERLRSRKPDLLLMDMMLPRLSGEDIARIMKDDPKLDAIPVLLMSAAPPSEGCPPAYSHGFLRKPFSLATLLRTVEGLIGRPGNDRAGR